MLQFFRIQLHVKGGQSHALWHGIDGGHWLELKRQKINARLGEEVVCVYFSQILLKLKKGGGTRFFFFFFPDVVFHLGFFFELGIFQSVGFDFLQFHYMHLHDCDWYTVFCN